MWMFIDLSTINAKGTEDTNQIPIFHDHGSIMLITMPKQKVGVVASYCKL